MWSIAIRSRHGSATRSGVLTAVAASNLTALTSEYRSSNGRASSACATSHPQGSVLPVAPGGIGAMRGRRPHRSTIPRHEFHYYHSGYEAGKTEGPYDPANGTRGVDTLIKSVEVNGIDRNANVYAELGSTSCAVQQLPRTFSASS